MNTTPSLNGFSELHCYSNFSFLKGASHPEELVQQAYKMGYSSIAITDECSIAGVVRGWRQAKKINENIKLIIGSSFQYEQDEFVLLAKNKASYAQLCQFISYCRKDTEKGTYQFDPTSIARFFSDGILLWKPNKLDDSSHQLAKIFQQQGLVVCTLLNLDLTHHDQQRLHDVQTLEEHYHFPIVATNSAVMHTADRKSLHDALCAIRLNRPITEIQDQLHINSEHHLRSLKRLNSLYPPSYIQNSEVIASQCCFSLDSLAYHYPEETVPYQHNPHFYLRQQTWQGAHRRYGKNIPKTVKNTLKKEFRLIKELQYEYYFLTVYDITQFAKSKRILHQGRGSAANSVVCFCLGITEVDPTKVNLLFERFISRRRHEPPDIDVDFDNSRREEVIQYLYKRYGRDRCAIAATVITYRAKSAVRDLGKALGLDMLYLEKAISNYGWRYRSQNWIDEIIDQSLSDNSHLLTQFKQLLSTLLGFPRHLSQHVGGFVLSQSPLNTLVPIENAAMKDRTVIQWDKDDLEAVKLMKIDVLALGMLSALQKCMDSLTTLNGRHFGLEHIPRNDDPNVYAMLRQADSVGLFQVESRAQMNMLPRLKPEKFYDLVVQVAIVRPGPIHGDMVHPYLKRKHGIEPVDVPLDSMKPILSRTFGVPIFQEQVIALSMIAADFSSEEAEELRRSMASWKKQGHMNGLRKKLSDNLSKKGVTQAYIERICKQIEGFGEYGFPESHAASFALIAYYSAWMKYYHPAIFCCALLNSQPMGFYPPWQLIQDAQQHGVDVLPIDVNKSQWNHSIQEVTANGITVRKVQLGMRLVKGLKQESGESIHRHKPSKGYHSINEVLRITALNQHEVEAISAAHGFQSLGENRYENRWQAQSYNYYNGLFQQQESSEPLGTHASRMDEFLEDLNATGVTLNDHPMAYLRDESILEDCITANALADQAQHTEVYVAGLVINRQRPKTSAGVTFITLEDETGSINLVVWLATAQKQLRTLTKSKILKVYGKIDKDESNNIVHLVAYRLFDISDQLIEYKNTSRDFH